MALTLQIAVHAEQQPLDRILAVVNGHVILQSDVQLFFDLALLPVSGDSQPPDALLTQLIVRRVVLDQVERVVVGDPDPALVDERLDRLRRTLPETMSLERVIERTGVTLDAIRQIIADDLRRDAYVRDRFARVDPSRRQDAVDEWVDGLLQRAEIQRN